MRCAAYHDVDATLPLFHSGAAILLITGTLGAVIRIREAFPSKRALFDIGVAGPIAGFHRADAPALLGHQPVAARPDHHGEGMIYFGEPLLYKAMAWLHFGAIPAGYDVRSIRWRLPAWLGMLATALNLMPFGQLDGGHIVYCWAVAPLSCRSRRSSSPRC